MELGMLKPLCRPSSCAHASRITAHQRIMCNVVNNEYGVGYLVLSLWLVSILCQIKELSVVQRYNHP